MCGIAGIIGERKDEALHNMLEVTRHRGPDDWGVWAEENISIGMNRLSIIDLSAAGHQPMFSQDERHVIVFNGEMYNFKEKRTLLEKAGYGFKSKTDTEVVLNLYLKFGVECLEHIRGMFAFVIWDRQEKKAFGARDRLAIKPLFYHFERGVLHFCSEIKGLLQGNCCSATLDPAALHKYLDRGYVTAPDTIFQDVKSLLPGHYFLWENRRFSQHPYWQLTPEKPSSRPVSYGEAVEQVRELVRDSVREELVSDVPVGVFLSGGLDSSVLAACAAEFTNHSIESFSIGFDDVQSEFDETTEAEISARHFGTAHNKHLINGKLFASELDGFICSIDQPSVDGINSYLVSKFARQKVTVALSGLGGDEVFFGYPWQRQIIYERYNGAGIFSKLLPFERALKHVPFQKLQNRLAFENARKDLSRLYFYFNRMFTPVEASNLLTEEWHNGHSVADSLASQYRLLNFSQNEEDITQEVSKADLNFFMAARLREGDVTSMHHSLETRFPLLDHRLVEFAYQLPADFKISQRSKPTNEDEFGGNQIKRLLLDAFKKELPEGFMQRRKKGFTFPFDAWMRSDLFDQIRAAFYETDNPFFAPKQLRRLFSSWENGQCSWARIWTVFVLLKWHESLSSSHSRQRAVERPIMETGKLLDQKM